ncbi:MAG TPA: carboxypeptidase regulatory-like domain-containing protein [Methylomirabilota bacterium]|nr:carboxypeptidase regulatory-like domain-containing protein [Methylomirabilota bacterium]
MTRRRAALGAALGLLLLAAAPALGYEVATVQDGGTITGTVKFVGTPPKLDPIPVNKNRDVCGDHKPAEALVLSADRGVKGSVILIEGVARGKKGGGEVVLDNHQCVFVSHVSAATVGERVAIRNSDPILHNTHGYLGTPTVFNVALPTKGQVIEVTKYLKKPGVVRVVCDAHPHMSAWMIVHDSPYYAVTDDKGAFRIADVPPGTYKITMWHAGFRPKGGVDKDGRPTFDEPRTVTRELTIAPKATATVDFELK